MAGAGRLICLDAKDFDRSQEVEIGSGNLGKVLSVPWSPTGGTSSRVAVKVLHNKTDIDQDEAKMLATINHRNVVNFLGIVCFDNRNCIVTELAHFGSLEEVLHKKQLLTLDDKLCFEWTLDIAKGLCYLHTDLDPGISHSDLKSSNVLIFDGKRKLAKICDFGKGRPLDQSAYVKSIGSLYWSAPEILAWEAHSLRSDVWAFAATVVEIFTRRQPYGHIDKKVNVVKDVKDGKLTPLHNLSEEQLSHFPQILRNLLPMCFLTDRTQRLDMATITSCLSKSQNTCVAQVQVDIPVDPSMAQFNIYKWKENKEFQLDLGPRPVLGKNLRAAIAERLSVKPQAIKITQYRLKRKGNDEDLLRTTQHRVVNQRGDLVPSEEVQPNPRVVTLADDDIVLAAEGYRALISVFDC